jgi:two-component system response regulator FlrC
MDAIEFSTDTARVHAPLVQRVAAIVAAVGRSETLWLNDAGDRTPARPGTNRILLERASQNAIVLHEGARGDRHYALAYNDPASDAALAALIACATRPGAPIAADPESLSVLSLAERLAASDIPVLVGGPTGTGKEVLSRFIHDRSPRAKGPLWPSTAPPCPRPCWRLCSSATPRARSPARHRRMKASSAQRTAARCCSTKSPKCR